MLTRFPSANRTLVYVEGEAKMNSYEDENGRKHSTLNLVQREPFLYPSLFSNCKHLVYVCDTTAAVAAAVRRPSFC